MSTGGDDFISARINFEMPPEATAQMRELNTELDRFRTNTEAAARGVDSFMRYIQLLNDAQERASQSSRNLASNLERVLQLQERAQGGQGTAVPQMYSTPWEASAPGMGGGDRGRIPTTVPTGGGQTMFDHLAANDPRAYLNARAAWGSPSAQRGEQLPPVSISDASLDKLAHRIAERDHQQSVQESKQAPSPVPGDDGRGSRPGPKQGQPWEAWRDRAAQWAGTAGNVAGALRMGGSISGALGAGGRALQGWGARLPKDDPNVPAGPSGTAPSVQSIPGGGEEPSVPTGGQTDENAPEGKSGGGMGGFGKALGYGGAGVAAGAGAFAAYKGIGGEIQQYRALGQIRGGGAGEGFGYEMQARMMAMNPFIKTEQARQIIQSALTEGYTGKEFDTVTDYMAHNLKDMNLSVADSSSLLHTAIKGSNKSVKELTDNLSSSMQLIQTLSKAGGYNASPERQQEFKTAFDAATAAGMDPTEAMKSSVAAGSWFEDMPGMQGEGGSLSAAFDNNLMFQIQSSQVSGVKPGDVKGYRPDDPGSFAEGLNDPQKQQAIWGTLSYWARNFTQHGNMGIWQRILQQNGINVSRSTARKYYNKAMAYGTGSHVNGAGDPAVEAGPKKITTKEDFSFNRLEQTFGGGAGGLGNAADSILGSLSPIPGMSGDNFHFFGSGASAGDSDMAKKIGDMFGSSAEVGGGNKWSEFNPSDPKQLGDLKSGKLHIRKKGEEGEGSTLDELVKGGGDGSGGDNSGDVQGQLHIHVHPASMRQVLGVPTFIPLTANEQKANAGFGNSTKNDPDPGDSVTSRGAR